MHNESRRRRKIQQLEDVLPKVEVINLDFLKYHLEHALTFISFAVVDPVLRFCCRRSSLERDAAALTPQHREREGDGDNWCLQNGGSVLLSQPQAE